MFCEKCGQQIPDNVRFCPYCSAPQEPLDEPMVQAPAPRRSLKALWITGIAVFGIMTAVFTTLGMTERIGQKKTTALAEAGIHSELPSLPTEESSAPDMSSAPVYSSGQPFQVGDVTVTLEEAYPWTTAENFLSDGYRYVQLWAHMSNETQQSVTSLSYDSFMIQYEGEIPQWMKDYQTVYGETILDQTFGASNRTFLTGEPAEGELYDLDDYHKEAVTLAPGEQVDLLLVYMAPNTDSQITLLVFSSLDAAKAGRTPSAEVHVPVESERQTIPESQIKHYDDPAATAAALSSYKRPDFSDIDGLINRYETEEALRAWLIEANGCLYINQYEALNGGWLGMINDYDNDKVRYFNAELTITSDGTAILDVDWYQVYDEMEKTFEDQTSLPNSRFIGTWNPDNATLALSNAEEGDVRIFLFAENTEGYQLALGNIEFPAGSQYLTPCFNMIRPEWAMAAYWDEETMEPYRTNVKISDLAPEGYTVPGAISLEGDEATQDETSEESSEESSSDESSSNESSVEEKPAEEPKPTSPSTEEVGLPVEADFEWIYTIIDTSELPENAELFYDPAQISGKWKAMILFFDDDDTISVRDMVNMTIQAGDRAATVIVDSHLIEYGEGWVDDPTEDYSFEGNIDTGTITAYGTYGNISLELFYTSSGKQYGLGYMMVPSGEEALLALVRP